MKQITYKTYQNNNKKSNGFGKWYARPVIKGTFEMKDLVEQIEKVSGVRKSDIQAVLAELSDTIQNVIGNGKRVHLEGLGYFKIGMSTYGVDNREDFTANSVKLARVIFQPESHKTSNGTRAKDWTEGIEFVEAENYCKEIHTPAGSN